MATDSRPVQEQDDYVAEPVLRLGNRNRDDDVEMDITPMIDVTFLLLIFFIVSSTMQQEQGLSLPAARAGSPISATNSAVLVLTKADGDNITVKPKGGDDFSADLETQEEEIVEFVRNSIAGTGGTGSAKQYVMLKASKGIKHKEVSRVAQAVSRAEIPNLYIAVKHEE